MKSSEILVSWKFLNKIVITIKVYTFFELKMLNIISIKFILTVENVKFPKNSGDLTKKSKHFKCWNKNAFKPSSNKK